MRDESVVQRVDYRSRCYACKSFKRLSLSVYATCIPFKWKDGGREKASEVMTIHPSSREKNRLCLEEREARQKGDQEERIRWSFFSNGVIFSLLLARVEFPSYAA